MNTCPTSFDPRIDRALQQAFEQQKQRIGQYKPGEPNPFNMVMALCFGRYGYKESCGSALATVGMGVVGFGLAVMIESLFVELEKAVR